MTTGRTMRAVALNQFGGSDLLKIQTVPLPDVGSHDVLIRVHVAGVGTWDAFEREGGYAEALPAGPHFPYILGSDGAGVIARVGDQVRRFTPGDRVYACAFLNPTGGFYAEYVAVDAQFVCRVPTHLTLEQAGVMAGVGMTALRGLDDILHIRASKTIGIVGASGGIGHIAVQLAHMMGARVLAVASGADGVTLVESLGADMVVDGRQEDLLAAISAFAPAGLDAALLTTGGVAAEHAIQGVRSGGRITYPNGIQPEPQSRSHVQMHAYNGEPDADIVQRFDHLVTAGSVTVHVDRAFPLEQVAEAHRTLTRHYLGKLALRLAD